MSAPSPICLVNSSSTTNGVNVTASAPVIISLASTADVDEWELVCLATDETNSAATINATIVVNGTAKTATFFAPSTTGSAMRFQSRVNRGRDPNDQVNPSLTTTFGVYVLTDSGARVLAVGETFEGNASFGWIGSINPILRTGGGELRRVANDSDTLFDWKLDEAGTLQGDYFGNSSSYANSGIAGGLLSNTLGVPVSRLAGVFGNCLFMPGDCGLVQSGSADTVPPSNSITMECWVKPRSFSLTQEFITKPYADGTWGAPYASVSFGIEGSGSGSLRVTISFGANGSATTATTYHGAHTAYDMVADQWNHVGFTFDGTTVVGYINGAEIPLAETSGPGTGTVVDWNSGSSADWAIAGINASGIQLPYTGYIDEPRVWIVVKDAAWFADVYRRALGLGTLTPG